MKILRKKVKILDEIKEQVELIADEGYVITTKEKPEEGEDQIYSPHLFLSFSDSVDNYVEILESDMPDEKEVIDKRYKKLSLSICWWGKVAII